MKNKPNQLNLKNFNWTDVMLIQMKDESFKEVIVVDIDDDLFSYDVNATGTSGDVTLLDINSGDVFGANDVNNFFNEDSNVAFFIRNTFLNRVCGVQQ